MGRAFDPRVAVAIIALSLASAMVAAGPANTSATATQVAHAAMVDPSQTPLVTWWEYPDAPPTPPTATKDEAYALMPTNGDTFAVLSNGMGSGVDLEDGEGMPDQDNGSTYRGTYDAVVLSIVLDVPSDADHIRIDYQFLSMEWPDNVGTGYNDGFIIELDDHTWSYETGSLVAPDNWAFDEMGNPIVVDQAAHDPVYTQGLPYGAGTCRYSTWIPASPGLHTLYLSVFDGGDPYRDSVALVDNIRMVLTDGPTPSAVCNYQEPPAQFSYEPTDPDLCGPITFTADSPTPDPGEYHWDFGDGATAIEPDPVTEHAYADTGSYLVKLDVYDEEEDLWSYGEEWIDVLPCSPSLQVDAQGPYYGVTGEPVAIAGIMAGVEPYACLWSGPGNFGAAGSCATDVTYANTGTYTITLGVTDGDANFASDTALVHIDQGTTGPTSGGPSSEQESAPDRTPADGEDPTYADADSDDDGIRDRDDPCPNHPGGLRDHDKDGLGDICDIDADDDGIENMFDNCWLTQNADQEDLDQDLRGDACDADRDGDGILDQFGGAKDNCPFDANPEQADLDRDGLGDACDFDIDGDGIMNILDAFPLDPDRHRPADGSDVEPIVKERSATGSVGVEEAPARGVPTWAWFVGAGMALAVIVVAIGATRR